MTFDFRKSDLDCLVESFKKNASIKNLFDKDNKIEEEKLEEEKLEEMRRNYFRFFKLTLFKLVWCFFSNILIYIFVCF